MAHNGTALTRLEAKLKEKTRKTLLALAQPLNTDTLKKMGSGYLDRTKTMFRTLCLALVHLQLKTPTKEPTEEPLTREDPALIKVPTDMPLTRVPPDVIEEAFVNGLKVGDFNDFNSGREGGLVYYYSHNEGKPYAAVITVEADGQWKFIFATLTRDGADVNFQEINRYTAQFYAYTRDYNLLSISKACNSTPYSALD